MIPQIRKNVLALIERIETPPPTRVRDKFILWPRRIGSRWYWLERVKWEEEYTEGYSCTGCDYMPAGYYFKRLIRDQENIKSSEPARTGSPSSSDDVAGSL